MDINQLDYTRAYISNLYRFIINKNKSATLPDMYYSNKILSQNNGSDYIEKLINSNEPFVTARFGSTELGCFHN